MKFLKLYLGRNCPVHKDLKVNGAYAVMSVKRFSIFDEAVSKQRKMKFAILKINQYTIY